MSKAFVELQVKENKVVVFSKTYCPYCKKAKEALSSTGLKDYALVELDEREDGDEIQDILKGITGGRSVGIISEVYFSFRAEETGYKLHTETGDLWRKKQVFANEIDKNIHFSDARVALNFHLIGASALFTRRLFPFFPDSCKL